MCDRSASLSSLIIAPHSVHFISGSFFTSFETSKNSQKGLSFTSFASIVVVVMGESFAGAVSFKTSESFVAASVSSIIIFLLKFFHF